MCGTNKILRAIVLLFRPNFFQLFIPPEKLMPSKLYWSKKIPIFYILSGWFLMFWWFNATTIEYWKHLWSLFFGFIVPLLSSTHKWFSSKEKSKTKIKAVWEDCEIDLKPLQKAIKQFIPRLRAVAEKQGYRINGLVKLLVPFLLV